MRYVGSFTQSVVPLWNTDPFQVEFRGPKGAMRYRKGMSKRIGMIAGACQVSFSPDHV